MILILENTRTNTYIFARLRLWSNPFMYIKGWKAGSGNVNARVHTLIYLYDNMQIYVTSYMHMDSRKCYIIPHGIDNILSG